MRNYSSKMNPFDSVPAVTKIDVSKVKRSGEQIKYEGKKLYVKVKLSQDEVCFIRPKRTKSTKSLEKAIQRAVEGEYKWDDQPFLVIDDSVLAVFSDRILNIPSDLINFYMDRFSVEGIVCPSLDDEEDDEEEGDATSEDTHGSLVWKLVAIRVTEEKEGSDDD